MLTVLQPPGWDQPNGFSNGIAAEGKQVFVGGQVGWNKRRAFESREFTPQAKQALQNIVSVLAEADAGPQHIARMTWYICDKQEYLANLKELGAVYREVIGRFYPAMTAVEVSALMEDDARVEIEVTAVVPIKR